MKNHSAVDKKKREKSQFLAPIKVKMNNGLEETTAT